MKHSIILSALIVILVAAMFGTAQVSSLRVTFSESIDPASGQGMGKVAYQDTHYSPDLMIFEALLPATNVEQCFATTDFSGARPVGPDRANLVYDFSTSTYHLTWMLGRETGDSCRVIIVGETAADGRYNTWRANFGSTSFAEVDMTKDEEVEPRTGDGSVRFVSYQIGAIYY